MQIVARHIEKGAPDRFGAIEGVFICANNCLRISHSRKHSFPQA